MTFIQKTLLTVLAALLPMSAAAAPANVTNVQAHLENGVITVSWNAAANADFYRVYYSHESILSHDGNYDDNERTQKSETTYTFKTLPLHSAHIFIAVLAVAPDGTESEGFETEAMVTLPAASSASSVTQTVSSSSSAAQSPDAAPTSIPMTVASVSAVTETGVSILMTKAVLATAVFKPEYFLLTDMSGTVLRIDSVVLSGSAIILHTQVQEAAKMYLLSILQPIPAADGTNAPTTTLKMQFAGFNPAQMTSSSSLSSSTAYIKNPALEPPIKKDPPEDPVSLALKAMRRSDGTYDIIAEWGASPDSQHSLDAYVLYVSQNDAKFQRNAAIPANQTAVKYSSIPAGVFGVKVGSKDRDGNESAGIEKSITLPKSGIGLLGITALSGLLAGRRTQRKRTVVR